jgi:hypothetical protein
MTGRTLVALSMLTLGAGCESVPSLTFEEGDAGDAGTQDASDAGYGCARNPMPTVCCNGLIPCYGNQCMEAGACMDCMCHASERCCPKINGTLMCVAANSPICP